MLKKSAYACFSSAYGTFSRTDHILGHKTNLNTFKSTEIISSIFSDHEMAWNQISTTGKEMRKNWLDGVKQHATKNQWVNEEIKREIKKYLWTNESENTTIQNLWDAIEAVLRAKFIAIQAFLKREEKYKVNQVNLPHKIIRKRRTNKTWSQLKEGNKRGQRGRKIEI